VDVDAQTYALPFYRSFGFVEQSKDHGCRAAAYQDVPEALAIRHIVIRTESIG
jgi:predicted GNAT family N-acyltransferase